jgi:hypothetical protein
VTDHIASEDRRTEDRRSGDRRQNPTITLADALGLAGLPAYEDWPAGVRADVDQVEAFAADMFCGLRGLAADLRKTAALGVALVTSLAAATGADMETAAAGLLTQLLPA